MEFIRPKRAATGIDLAPLIDCVFLLLIFFMLSSSSMQSAIPLVLPSSSSKEMPEPNRIIISINEAEQLFVNDVPVTLDGLGARLLELTKGDTGQSVLFRGDRAIRYEQFIGVVTETRKAGFRQLSLQHQAPAVPVP
jgi:biopolymer transport protein ExbD